MEKGKMEKFTNWLSRKSDMRGSNDSKNDDFQIGQVAHFTRVVHVEKDTEGGLKGLPPDFQIMLESMTTAQERANAQNTETAKQIIIWNAEQQKKNQQKDFMQVGKYESNNNHKSTLKISILVI